VAPPVSLQGGDGMTPPVSLQGGGGMTPPVSGEGEDGITPPVSGQGGEMLLVKKTYSERRRKLNFKKRGLPVLVTEGLITFNPTVLFLHRSLPGTG